MADNKLQYDNTASTSSKGKAILGRLTGPCADIIHSTRNGRKYSQKLWEKVFSDPIVKEYFESIKTGEHKPYNIEIDGYKVISDIIFVD